jgi:hypothetical protein
MHNAFASISLVAMILFGSLVWHHKGGLAYGQAGSSTPVGPTQFEMEHRVNLPPGVSLEKESAAENTFDSRQDDPLTERRLREGTIITNRLGHFRLSGGRAMFVTDDGIRLGGLPNLGLERVVLMLKSVEEPDSIWWSVSGTVTEFADRNYLLIKRAVYRSATPPPRPVKLEPEKPKKP